MHPNANARRPLLWGLVLVAGLVGPAAHGQQPVVPVGVAKVDRSGALIVPLGGTVQFDPRTPDAKLIVEIFNRNEDILQARPDAGNPRVVVMTGRAPGLSQITLTYADRTKAVYDVVVQPDYDLLRNVIKRTVPTASVEVIPGVGNVIILSGYVTSPGDADIIQRIASSVVGGNPQNIINAMQVGGVQQVQIDVVVASVDRTEARSRGFDFFVNARQFQFNSIVGGLLGQNVSGAGLVAGGATIVSPDANLAFAVVPGRFIGALRALRTEGLAKFLAEPRVVTQTGRPAFFRSGGQQATLGPASGINGPGVQLVPFGTELEVLPIVYGNGKIWLEVNPRITSVNNALGITTSFGTTPGFSEQNVRSAVMLESGQTFAIGGLIQNSVSGNTVKVPVIGDLPYLGRAFSRENFTTIENELVVMVTPRLVEAMDCEQVPKRLPGRETRNPDDYELFLEGVLEAPRGQRQVWTGHCYNAPYKCDPTYGTFPCIGNVCGGGATGAGGACGANGCAAPGVVTGPAAPAALPIPAAVTPAPVVPITPVVSPATTGTVRPTADTTTTPVGLPADAPTVSQPAGQGGPAAAPTTTDSMPLTLPPPAPVAPGN